MLQERFYIQTHHQTLLCINLLTGHSSHQTHEIVNATPSLHPLGLEINGGKARFYIGNTGLRVFLGSNETRAPELQLGKMTESEDYLISWSGEGFSLQLGGFFLCAERDGPLVCNRLKVNAWEQFSIRYA